MKYAKLWDLQTLPLKRIVEQDSVHLAKPNSLPLEPAERWENVIYLTS